MARNTPSPTNPAEQHNILGKDTVIEGTLRSSGNVHISGTVKGNVEVQGRTVIMPGGIVDGELVSITAEIGGTVNGQISVKERLVLKSTAVVEGDIRTAKLVIEDGATFTGRCDMSGSSSPQRSEQAEITVDVSRPTRRLGGNPDVQKGSVRV
ncbi:MAG: polymer-forming cytoskeletal protein [Bacteroidetes bacterium]|nr:polymer-forming cytoskeletal protein [Bacteroidota bacterium]